MMDKQVLEFFEKSVREFYCGGNRFDWRDTANIFERVLVSLGGLYIDPEYRRWISDCIVHVRDIRSGHGIRELAYVLLAVWYCYYPDEADLVMLRFVVGGAGCWSDIKRFLWVWRELGYHTDSRNGGLVEGRVVAIMIDHIWTDYGMGRGVGMVAKWVPREKSRRYGWLYDLFVLAWGAKAGWRGERMDKWRCRFRKILVGMGGCAAPKVRLMEPKDLVRLAMGGGGGDGGAAALDQKWREVLDKFCSICDFIPIVIVKQCWGEELYSKLAYAILIAQMGIGRIMVDGGYWVVSTKTDSFSDIISRIRGVLDGGCGAWGGSCAMDLIREASETSGYENPQVLLI